MKKIFKKTKTKYLLFTLLGVIIGGGIFGTLGIVATTNKLEAKYVMYTKDGETMTVQDAIKDLYVKASKGNNQTLVLGTPDVVSYTVTVPYTGNYPTIRCVYGTTENYGSEGTISGNKCTFTGSATNQTLYYKIIATDNNGKIYENSGSAITSSFKPISINELALGDYIYMKPTKTSYSITSDMTGCVSGLEYDCNRINGASQTINPSELTVWRVIRKNSDGTVDVVSENVSSTNVYFYGQTGYQNFIGTLNTIAAQYTNDNYVQRTRYMGYSNQTQNITNTSKLTQTTAPWTVDTYEMSSSTLSANESLGAGDMGYKTDETLVNTALGTLKAKKPSENWWSDYWIASRKYTYTDYNDAPEWFFTPRFVDTSGSVTSMFYLRGYVDYYRGGDSKYAIRPILTLKSTVKVIGVQDVTSDSKNIYQLGL